MKFLERLCTLVAALLVASTMSSCDDEMSGATSDSDSNGETICRKVAVFCLSEDYESMARTAQWVMEEIGKASMGDFDNVKVDFTWTLCDTDPDWALDLEGAQLDTTVDVIIGPSASQYAKLCIADAVAFAKQMEKVQKSPKPIIFPQTSSAEVQRIAAGLDYIWFMQESDVDQAEVLISVSDSLGQDKIHVISSDESYGQSYYAKVPFIATVWDMRMGSNIVISPTASDDEVIQAMEQICPNHTIGADETIFLASSSERHYSVVDSISNEWGLNANGQMHVIFSDNSASGGEWDFKNAVGISTGVDDPDFAKQYEKRFNEGLPMDGEANDYDSFLMAYFTVLMRQMKGCDAREAARLLVGGEDCLPVGWDSDGITAAVQALTSGSNFCFCGASGLFIFTNGVRLYNVYYLWRCLNSDIQALKTILSVAISKIQGSNANDWTLDDPDEAASDHVAETERDKIPLDEQWAIVVATSKGWANYRHDADALAMYQLLKWTGFDDRHILLVINDEIAGNDANPYPGQVFWAPGYDDVYSGAQIDYRTHDITPSQLWQIALTSEDFAPDADDNVFVFWTGHGNSSGNLCWQGNAAYDVTPEEFNQWVGDMDKAGRYRKMLICIEACFSGAIANGLSQDGVICITAANGVESSVVHDATTDPVLLTYRTDEFTYQLISGIYYSYQNGGDLPLSQLYRQLYMSVPTSHVTLSKTDLFGCLVHTDLRKFIAYEDDFGYDEDE